MVTATHFTVFLSGVSKELASYRDEVARVLRRKGITVVDQRHFRQGGTELLQTLYDYIDGCDAVICLIGDQCGLFPSEEHMTILEDSQNATRYREASGSTAISYTQWEYVIAQDLNKPTYLFLSTDEFEPDHQSTELIEQQTLQASYRSWIKYMGSDRQPLNMSSQLIEDVLVLGFPDVLQGKPENLPQGSLGTLFKGRREFLNTLHEHQQAVGATVITDKVDPQRPRVVQGAGGIGKTRTAIEYAWRQAGTYSALLFISAENAPMLDSRLAQLTDVLPLQEFSNAPDEQRINAVLNWLNLNSEWLLIIDNADTEEAAGAIKSYLAQLTRGHVLITSRLAQWGTSVETLDLGVLDLPDATDYLLEATEQHRTRLQTDEDDAEQVAICGSVRSIGEGVIGRAQLASTGADTSIGF